MQSCWLTCRCAAAQPRLRDAQPDLFAQLAPGLNDPAVAEKVTLGSVQKMWWACSAHARRASNTEGSCGHDHIWRTMAMHRARKGTGCPVCSGHQPCSPSCGSLLAVHPDVVAAEWDEPANLPLTPGQLRPQSHKLMRWRCQLNPQHKWVASPNKRFSSTPSGCPACAHARRGKQKVDS